MFSKKNSYESFYLLKKLTILSLCFYQKDLLEALKCLPELFGWSWLTFVLGFYFARYVRQTLAQSVFQHADLLDGDIQALYLNEEEVVINLIMVAAVGL